MRSDDPKWKETFLFCMQQLAGVYGREFNQPSICAYRDACADWDIERMTMAFQRAIKAEKFCPTVATLIGYGSSVHQQAGEVVPAYRPPQYTPEQAEDIRQMLADLRRKGINMPWSMPLPEEN